MPDSISRRDRDHKLRSDAERAFSGHQIAHRTEGRYRLAPTQNVCPGFGSVDVLLGFSGALYVGGDTSTVAFAYGPEDYRARIAWIGGTNDVGYYVTQKAEIGTRSGIGVWAKVFDPAVATHELAELIEERVALLEDHELDPSEVDALTDLLESDLSEYDEGGAMFARELCERIDDGWEFEIGMVTRPSIYFAWAAVRRLHLLLLAEEGVGCEKVGDD